MATTTDVTLTATTTSLSSATPSACGSQLLLEVPDIACGIPNNKENHAALEKCAKDAPVETFADECGIYALAFGQSVGDLNDCLQDAKVNPADIRCNGQMTAIATATELPSKTESASETESASKTDGSPATSTETDGAAGSLKEHSPSRFALSVIGFLVCSLTAGAAL